MSALQSDSTTKCVLIVDEDDLFRDLLFQNLSNAGLNTVAFAEGRDALGYLAEGGISDIILLDWNMPRMTSIELLTELRSRRIETPVVFLTAQGDQIHEEAGLHGGAADFIEKSRGFLIIVRRIELILGRHLSAESASSRQNIFTHGQLELRRDLMCASWKNTAVGLTATEFKIVDHLATRAGRDVRYRELYDLVRGEGFIVGSGETGYRVNVRTFIKRIRRKFQIIDAEFAQIENYLGFGYRWSEQDNQPGPPM
jgi:two-component system response regulator ChvI